MCGSVRTIYRRQADEKAKVILQLKFQLHVFTQMTRFLFSYFFNLVSPKNKQNNNEKSLNPEQSPQHWSSFFEPLFLLSTKKFIVTHQMIILNLPISPGFLK